MRRFPLSAVWFAVLLVLAGCGGSDAAPPGTTEAPLPVKSVVVSNSVLGDFVSVIAGDRVDVRVLSPSDQDPRRYTLTPSDVTAVANADLVLANGLGLEPWFDSFIPTAEHRGPVVLVSTGTSTRANENGVIDPFVWVSPSNARVVVANVRAALVQIDPAGASLFQTNERAYNAQIDGVINYAQRSFASVQKNRLAFVDEPLGYYCDEFHLTCNAVAAAPYLASASPSPAQAAALVTALKAANPKAVVFSPDVAGSVAGAVKSGVKAKVLSGEDALGVASLGGSDSRRVDYLALQRDIADAVSSALN